VPLSPSSIIWYQPMGGDDFRQVTTGLAESNVNSYCRVYGFGHLWAD